MASPAPRSPSPGHDPVPSRTAAVELSGRLLADQGTRFQHVCRAGEVAHDVLAVLFTAEEHRLLVAAATLHDIGYAPTIARTGFHPVDGASYLRDHGYSLRLAGLVAHHSHAELLAPDDRTRQLLEQFPEEGTLLTDALAYADMHSDPGGLHIHPEERLADIEQRHPGPNAKRRTLAQWASIRRVRAALARASQPVRSR